MSDVAEEFQIVLRTCPMCGRPVDVDDRQCGHCGEALKTRPPETLHPLRGAVWAGVLGGIAAAGIVLAINYARMGRKPAAWWIAICGIVATLVFVVGTELAAPDLPNFVILFFQIWVVYLVANALQGKRLREHIRKGGAIASAWQGVGIGALSGIVIVAVIFGLIYAFESDPVTELLGNSYGKVVKFGHDEVYYSGEATEADARKLAAFLKKEEFFGQEGGVSVRIQAESGRYTVSFILQEGAWNDADVVAYFRQLARDLSPAVFPRPLTVLLCNDEFERREAIVLR